MADICANCEKQVYFNEKLKAVNKIWHKTCFKCADCDKRINLGQQLEHDDKPFCKICHQKNFGARGFRGGGGASGLMVQGNYGGAAPVKMPSEQWSKNKFDIPDTDSNVADKTEQIIDSYEAPPKNNPKPLKPKPTPTRYIEDTNYRDDEKGVEESAANDEEDMGLLEMIQNHEYYIKAHGFVKEKLGPYLGDWI
mmetsp:Transcript_19392/g.23589  ORF Transcript_19392/g.23589 Transcript_19392/m.23589 type:complete len:195 (+) Transcript_19392:62-646(+)